VRVKAYFLLFSLVVHILTSRLYRVTLSKLKQLYWCVGFGNIYYGAVTMTFRKKGTWLKTSHYISRYTSSFADWHIKSTDHRSRSRFFPYLCTHLSQFIYTSIGNPACYNFSHKVLFRSLECGTYSCTKIKQYIKNNVFFPYSFLE
jgi:hypothetical protein